MRYVIVILFGFLLQETLGQALVNKAGFVPELSIGYKVNNQLKLNAKVESFHSGFTAFNNDENAWSHKYEDVDIQLFASSKVNPLQTLAVGFQYGIEPGETDNYRIIQQYSLVTRAVAFRLGHRFRTDQTFYAEEKFKFRGRYRLSAEFSLQGQTIDPGEFYLLASDEIIYGIQNKQGAFENRLIVSLGHYFASRNKLQVGLDYRNDFSNGFTSGTLWFRLGCYINIYRA